MFIGRLFDNTSLNMLKKGIEGTLERHKAISNNIANVDTPNYQRATVSFEEEMKRSLRGIDIVGRRTHPAHFVIGGPQEIKHLMPRVEIDNMTRFRPDQNNVNIDEEMANLAHNTQKNEQFTTLISKRYSGIDNVIRQAGQV